MRSDLLNDLFLDLAFKASAPSRYLNAGGIIGMGWAEALEKPEMAGDGDL